MSSANPFSMSSRPASAARYARYIGRVGALAVSLGVGFAVATTPGVARADDTTNATAPSDPPSESTPAPSAGSTASAPESLQTRVQERRRILQVFGGTVNRPVRPSKGDRPGAGPRNGGGAATETSGGNAVGAVEGTAAETTTAEPGSGPGVTRVVVTRGSTVRKSANDVVKQLVPRPTVAPPAVERPERRVVAERPARRAIDLDVARALSPRPPVTKKEPVVKTEAAATTTTNAVAGGSTPTPSLNLAAAPAPTAERVAQRPAALVSGFLAAVGLAPSLTSPAAPAPAPAPFVWTVLAFVRREIEQVHRTFFNRTPNAIDDPVSTNEDTALVFDPRANDRDDDTLAVSAVTNGTYGTVTTNGTTVTYTPNAAANALAAGETVTDTFTYTVTDENSAPHLHGFLGLFSRGHTDTATVTVTLTGVNDPPVAVDDIRTDSISEDGGPTPIDVLANDTDPDHGATLTVTDPTNGTYGRVDVNTDGRSVTYTPNDAANALAAGETQTDTFTYTVSDGKGGTDTATVTVTVAGANDAPYAVNDQIDTPISEDALPTRIDVLANDSDPDRTDTLTITGVTNGTYGNVTKAADGKSVTYTPNAAADALPADATRRDTFTYLVSDGKGGLATATVSVTVTGANDAPSTGFFIGVTDEDTPISGSLPAGDPDGDALTYTIASPPKNGTLTSFNSSTGEFTYKPNPDYSGFDDFTFTVSDGKATSPDAGVVRITVNEVPDVTVTQTVGDVGREPTDVAVTRDGRTGFITNPDGTVTVIEADDDGWSVGPTVEVGDSPWRVDAGIDRAYVIDETDGSLWTLEKETDWGTATRSADYEDLTDVRLGAGYTDDVVWAVDSGGTLKAIDGTTLEERASVGVGFQFRMASADSVSALAAEPSTSRLAVAPTGQKVYVSTGRKISVVEARRVSAVALRTADASASAADESLSLEVVDALDVDGDVTALEVSPDGTRLYATVVKDGAASLVAYDTTGESLVRVDSVDVGTSASRVAVSADGNRAYVTGDAGVSVVDVRRARVVERLDTGKAAGVAVVPGRGTVLVANPDAGKVQVVRDSFTPSTVANPDTTRTGEDNSVVINVLANDTDTGGATLAPTVVRGPANGTVTVNSDGTVTYRPNADFSGSDSFTYSASGGTSNAAPTTVTVTVTPAITTQLTWDDNPADLDAHLIGPSATGSGADFHVFYANPTYNLAGTGEQAVFLTADDTSGYGPEVIEINTRTPGEYLYYVHKFSGGESLAQSNAVVTVVDPSTGLQTTFEVDPESSGAYWSVFKLTISETGAVTIMPVNAYSDTEPTLGNAIDDPPVATAL